MSPLSIVMVTACGLSVMGTTPDPSTQPSSDGGPGANPSLGDGQSSSTASDGAPSTDADTSDGSKLPGTAVSSILIASQDALWRLNPTTNEFKRIGTLASSCKSPQMEELALSSKGELIGTSSDATYLYRVSIGATEVTCQTIKSGLFPFALAWVPPGAAGAQEMLVAFSGAGDYLQINPSDGSMTTFPGNGMRPYGPGGDFASAGGKKGYVVAAKTPDCNHCLVEVELTAGNLVGAKLGDIGEGAIYGAAYANGKVYGFANASGKTYVMTPSPFSVTSLPPPEPNTHWYGATSAPVP